MYLIAMSCASIGLFFAFKLHVPQHGQLYKTVVLAARRVSRFTALWRSAQEARVTRVAVNRTLSNSYPSLVLSNFVA